MAELKRVEFKKAVDIIDIDMSHMDVVLLSLDI